jgi:uncharacterized membrane protein
MARDADMDERDTHPQAMKWLKFSVFVEVLLAAWLLLSVGLLLIERHFLFKLVCKEWPEDILC